MDALAGFLRFILRARSGRELILRLTGLIVIGVAVVIFTSDSRGRVAAPPDPIDALPTRGALTEVGTLAMGGTVSAVLGAGERHAWGFTGELGQRISLRVRGEIDSTLELIPPDGTESIAIDFSSGGGRDAFLCNLRLARSGTYRAVVSTYLGLPNYASGPYELSLAAETAIETRPIAFGTSIDGRLTTCDGDYYALDVQPGDTALVTLQPDAGANLYVALQARRDSTEILAFSRESTGADGAAIDSLNAEFNAAGTVILRVSRPPDEPEAGYRLTVERGP